MLKDEYIRVAAVVPAVSVADCEANADAILRCADEQWRAGARVIVTPELSVTAYTCGDLFGQRRLLDAAEQAVARICRGLETAGIGALVAVGAPVRYAGNLYNCAVMICGGRIAGIVPKSYLPTYGEFYEGRWWRPGRGVDDTVSFAGQDEVPIAPGLLFELCDRRSGTPMATVGVEICEDLWAPVPPSSLLALGGAQILLNLSASDDTAGKYDYLCDLVAGQSGRCMAAYVYASAGFGESSTDLVFDGKAMIAVNGAMKRRSGRWGDNRGRSAIADIDIEAINHDRMTRNTFDDCRRMMEPLMRGIHRVRVELDCTTSADSGALADVSPHPFVPGDGTALDSRADEIIAIQVAGLAQRLSFTRCRSLVVGISGGLDSTLALLVATEAFDRLGLPREGITGITMPGFGTTDRTHDNAVELMRLLGVTAHEICIGPAVMQHFNDIGHDVAIHDVTYENSQARERTQILMDMANRTGGMVLGTGDMSELALGWATYNGDHMSMYGVNAGVPKTLVRHLVRRFEQRASDSALARVLHDIIDTPISPELIPADDAGNITQRTEDLVGPYELHDFFLYHMLRYGRPVASIRELARRAFAGRYDGECIDKWLSTFVRRFFSQQFKRSCMPDGPKVGSVCLSPRGDWRMPSDASRVAWND